MDDIKSSHIGLILLFLLIAGVGGFFFYFYQKSQSGTSQDSISQGATSTWKTYANTAYGFAFKYPSNRTVFQSIDQSNERLVPASASSDSVFVAHREAPYIFSDVPQTVNFRIIHVNIDPRVWFDQHQGEFFKSSPKYVKDTSFAGKRALEAGGNEESGTTYLLFVVPLGNNLLIVNQNAKTTLLDDVVKSFRFTE